MYHVLASNGWGFHAFRISSMLVTKLRFEFCLKTVSWIILSTFPELFAYFLSQL